jgi:phytoene/squalene synthetase
MDCPSEQNTAAMARSITWAASKQSYFIGRLMVDKDLKDDFLRAYAYFRWVDDVIDISSQSDDERINFIKRQRKLIDRLYEKDQPDDLTPEEEILKDLINHDKGEESGLQSFIRNMFAIIEFDVYRKGGLISQEDLIWYTDTLSKSVMDGLLYFIGNNQHHSYADNRYDAVCGAHIAHLLRDMMEDLDNGFINIPDEYLKTYGISSDQIDSPAFRAWVKSRVESAQKYFAEGKLYLDGLGVLRSKLVGYWYIARFEGVLDAIERDGYILRPEYNERRKFSTLLRITWMSITITYRHFTSRRSTRKFKNRNLQVNKEFQPSLSLSSN